MNEAANLKTCWELFQSDMQWANFLRSRILKGSSPISYHISSSVWSSVKHKFNEISSNSSWLVGNGEMINFWLDPWCGEPLVLALDIPYHLHPYLKAKVTHFIENKKWKIPACLMVAYPAIHSLIHSVTIPLGDKEDKLFWKH